MTIDQWLDCLKAAWANYGEGIGKNSNLQLAAHKTQIAGLQAENEKLRESERKHMVEKHGPDGLWVKIHELAGKLTKIKELIGSDE